MGRGGLGVVEAVLGAPSLRHPVQTHVGGEEEIGRDLRAPSAEHSPRPDRDPPPKKKVAMVRG